VQPPPVQLGRPATVRREFRAGSLVGSTQPADGQAGSGIVAPACLAVDVSDTDAALLLEWVDGLTLSQVSAERQYRYGGGGEVDAGFKFRERSRALLFNAGWARQALDLADDLGL